MSLNDHNALVEYAPLKIMHRTPMGVITEDVPVGVDKPFNVWHAVHKYGVPVNTYPTVCFINGEPVLRKDWNKFLDHRVRDVMFLTMPKGGAFKNILGLVATIALTLVAPYAAGALGSLLGITSKIGLQLLQAGIVLAGSFLIGTFLQQKASTPSSNDAGAASPTYTLEAQGNQARLYEPIPKLYGTHMIYPDYAAQPYSEFINNDQYLNQLFCMGLGRYGFHQLRIEDTAFWNETDGMLPSFSGIQMEIIPPGSAVTLFHSQVITSEEVTGQDLRYWTMVGINYDIDSPTKKITARNSSSNETKQFRLAAVGDKFVITTGPNAGLYTIDSIATDLTWITTVEAIPSSQSNAGLTLGMSLGDNWAGPFIANTADTVTNKLQFDIVFGSGLFYTNDDGELSDESAGFEIQAQLVNSAGVPIGSWTTLGTPSYTRRTATPQRFTETYLVADGRYQCRMHRTSPENASSRYRSSAIWSSMKAYIPNDNIYPDVTLIALRMLATGQLTASSSKKVNSIQTSYLRWWSTTTETWQPEILSSSIAWAAADVLTNDVYGIGYDDQYVDLFRLAELDVLWGNRGDSFNAVFDTTYSIWDALTAILRCGRTVPIMIGGKITFVRDELRALPRGVFTPASIQKGSFQAQHIMFDDESPDDIRVQFMDSRTWRQNSVVCKQTGSISDKPEDMQFFGITDRSQAWREGMFIGAVNAKRRIIASFTSEMEGRMLMRGDLISVAHDLYDWGETGQVQGYDAGTRELFLTEPFDWGSETDGYIRLRKRNARGWGPVKVHPSDYEDVVIVDGVDLLLVEASQGSITSTFSLDTDGVLTEYVVGYLDTTYKDFIIVSGQPKDELVDITCIVEDPSVHTVDEGPVPPEDNTSGASDPSRPVISWFSGSESTVSDPNNPTVIFGWGASSNANYYRLQISYDNVNFQTAYEGTSTGYTTTVYPGALFARVQGVNTQTGNWKLFSGVFGIGSMTPLPVTHITNNYSISGGQLSIAWDAAIRATSYRAVVYSESVTGSGIFDTTELTRTVTTTAVTFNSSDVTDAGGPWPNIKIGVTAINSLGEATESSVVVTGIVSNPVTGLSLQNAYARNTLTAQWNAAAADHYNIRVIVDGVTKLTYTSLANTQMVTLADMTAVGGPWRQFTIGVVAVAGTLTSSEATLVVVAPTITSVTGVGATVAGVSNTGTVTLNWNQTVDNDVAQTRVWRSTTNTFGSASVINTQTKAAGASATYADTGLAPNTYYYWITAYDNVLLMESSPVAVTATVEALPLALSTFTSTYAAPRLGRAVVSFTTAADTHVTNVKLFRVAAGAAFNADTATVLTTIPVVASTTYNYTDGDATRTNLFGNPSFDDATVWSATAGWAIASGVAHHTGGTASNLSQTVSLTASTAYRFGYELTATTTTQPLSPYFAGGTTVAGVSRIVTGKYSEVMTAVSGNTSAGLTTSTNIACDVDNMGLYVQSGTSLAGGSYDYYAVPYNSQGAHLAPGSMSKIPNLFVI